MDKGLEPEKDGVQLMKPIPNLAEMCDDAIAHGVFGTKMRSVINFADLSGVKQIVEQQFELGKSIMAKGLIPILEPEVNIKSPEKTECEAMLRSVIMEHVSVFVFLKSCHFRTFLHMRSLTYPCSCRRI